MVRKELIGRSKAMVTEARWQKLLDYRQRPQLRGPVPPHVERRARMVKLPPSWVERIVPRPITKYIKPYAMKMHFTNRSVTAEVFDTVNSNALVVRASSRDDDLKQGLESLTDVAAAAKVGEAIAEKLKEKGIPGVTYFRSKGELYHGKRKALLDRLRETGVKLI